MPGNRVTICGPRFQSNLSGDADTAMKLPPRKSTLFLALFLFLHGGLIVLELDNVPTLQAISGILAIAAGVFYWIDR